MNFRYILLTAELDQMSDYLDVVHKALKEHRRNFMKSVKKTVKGMTEEEAEEFYMWHEDDYIEVAEGFPQFLFLNFIVAWYSFVEQELLHLCGDAETKKTTEIQANKNLGKGIRRAYNFLLDSKKYRINGKDWNELVVIGELRNKIVHSGEIVRYSRKNPDKKHPSVRLDTGVTVYPHIDKNFYRYLKKYNLLKYTGMFSLTPTVDYCDHLQKFPDSRLAL